MIVDIGEVKRHIKPKADSTIHNMRKDALIAYIRCLENNYNVAVSFNENQAKYIESLNVVEVRCEECLYRSQYPDENGRYLCGGILTEDDDLVVKVMPGFYCGYGEKRGKNA